MVGEMEAAHTWLTARSGLDRYNCRVASDRLMGNWVNVALNRGDESLGRVWLPN
jgi:hypothetical protein